MGYSESLKRACYSKVPAASRKIQFIIPKRPEPIRAYTQSGWRLPQKNILSLKDSLQSTVSLKHIGYNPRQKKEDSSVYLYTHLEPYKANYVAPLFDQPDLKASYTVDIRAQGDWAVVTAT
ncbi:hypothetical protein OQJ46_03980 [Microbulbifer thermotolerans]|uniref:hypothetical protein n=1 Tax=Microbulbifer thermotolerans TaxID=252514 RepID=UPI0008EC53F5|nr:hypothetical protein [Microbulbifer thermotolerans]MCX2782149.1 hypothetical protein [Microbulbifer thermotolerans]MCX2836070.1 hypothetical protein [Microbulbifer thermotolerans]SFD01621.1 Peptidase family M1 [Microbulbifer thermotolerans]